MSATQFRSFPKTEVFVWNVALNAIKARRADFERLLSRDEQERANRFRRAEDATRFVLAHGALREILSLYAPIPAAQWRFNRNGFGKPFLARDAELDLNFNLLKFNLSYRHNRALVAISRGCEIGIDIERFEASLEAPFDVRALSENVCSAAEKTRSFRVARCRTSARFFADVDAQGSRSQSDWSRFFFGRAAD